MKRCFIPRERKNREETEQPKQNEITQTKRNNRNKTKRKHRNNRQKVVYMKNRFGVKL